MENVGAIFRTADAAGISKIYLTGYTPAPLDRFGKKRKDLAKSALGAEEFVKWEQRKSTFSLLAKLKKENFLIIGIEQDKKSVDYKIIRVSNPYKYQYTPHDNYTKTTTENSVFNLYRIFYLVVTALYYRKKDISIDSLFKNDKEKN